MKPFTVHRGRVAPLDRVNVDTDQIIPKQFLKRIERTGFGPAEMGDRSVFQDLMLLAIENRRETDPEAPRILPAETANQQTVSMNSALALEKGLPYIYWLMDRDRKSTALKSLQGKIWKSGFESGELKGVLFDDVPDILAGLAARVTARATLGSVCRFG